MIVRRNQHLADVMAKIMASRLVRHLQQRRLLPLRHQPDSQCDPWQAAEKTLIYQRFPALLNGSRVFLG